MKERLKLVTAFSELRAGMIVVVKPGDCGRENCRLFLLKPGNDGLVNGWFVLASCGEKFLRPFYVAQRRVFKVEDGLDAETTRSAKRDTKLPSRVRP